MAVCEMEWETEWSIECSSCCARLGNGNNPNWRKKTELRVCHLIVGLENSRGDVNEPDKNPQCCSGCRHPKRLARWFTNVIGPPEFLFAFFSLSFLFLFPPLILSANYKKSFDWNRL